MGGRGGAHRGWGAFDSCGARISTVTLTPAIPRDLKDPQDSNHCGSGRARERGGQFTTLASSKESLDFVMIIYSQSEEG